MPLTMSSYYAHESEIGPVFDVAHFSPAKAVWTGIIGIVFGAAIGLAAAYVWNPDWLISKPSDVIADAQQDIKNLMQTYPLGTRIAVGGAGLFALLCLVAGLCCLVNAVTGNFYIRVGEGGLSLPPPDGFVGVIKRDLSWSEIANLTVVQDKQFGALSQSAGNMGGELRLKTTDGWARDIRLDYFRPDAWLIYQRIQEAMQTRPAELV